ncbi:MAG: helix-turn-helix transcriptional regulator [Bacteroidetes bacterium]|nr:helix-turn-helix transcriptional regulator [Bacteroidota bacterium]
MNTNKENFGSFLKQLRTRNDFSLREFSRILGIAPSYLSDIEQSKRNAPKKEHLEKMIQELKLNADEIEKFYDLARKGKPVEIAEDVKEIITENDSIPVLCRKIKQKNINVDDLIKRIEFEKKDKTN